MSDIPDTSVGAMLAESATRLLERADLASARRTTAEGGFADKLWSQIHESGFPMLLCSEDAGGIAGTLADAAAIARLYGAKAVPAPLIETMIGNQLATIAGQQADERPLALLLGKAARSLVEAWKSGSAEMVRIPWAPHADVLVITDGEDAKMIRLRAPADAMLESRVNLAGEPRNVFSATQMQVIGEHRIAVKGEETLASVALLRAALLLGAMDRAMALSAAYTADRQQFGRALSQFQMIQQTLAVMATEVAASQAAVFAAAEAPAQRRIFMAAVAKARVSEAAGTVAAMAHQVHGAMGFTDEYELGLFTKRLWAWRDEDGTAAHWQNWLGAHARVTGDFWPLVAP